jgi:hypothetical protein
MCLNNAVRLLPLEELSRKRVSLLRGWTNLPALLRNPFTICLALRGDIMFQGLSGKYKYKRNIYIIKAYMNKIVFVISFKIHQHHDPVLYSLNQTI